MTLLRRACLLLIAALLCGCGDYVVENDAVYYRQAGWFNLQKIEGADPASFRRIDRDYAADRDRAYFRGLHIDGADPAAIQRIDGSEYARDGHDVYSQTTRVPGAHVASFRSMGRFGVDRQRGYFGSIPRELCDIASLSADVHGWYTDRQCVYSPVNLARIEEADRSTFQSLGIQHARDARRGYSLLSPIGTLEDARYGLRLVDDVCDVASLRIERGWLLDDQCVYDQEFRRIEHVDRASFRIITTYYAADGQQVFDIRGVRRHELDAATARPHGRECATCIRDDIHCFNGDEQVSCRIKR